MTSCPLEGLVILPSAHWMKWGWEILTAMSLLAGALGRDMAQAPASQSKPIADLLFILSADMVSMRFPSSCAL